MAAAASGRRLWLLVALVCAALAVVLFPRGTVAPDEDFDIMRAVPHQIAGWKRKPPTRYTAKDLHVYINGGAELYLSYGFREAFSFVFEQEGEPDIVLDVFDMSSPGNASGVFAHSAENAGDDFGQGSEASSGLIVFWKGRHYVSILAWPQTEASSEAAADLGRLLSESLPEE